MKKAIWRSRAITIIGFLTMLLVVFNGLPSALEKTLFFVFGFLSFAFGLAGSRHKSYGEFIKPQETVEYHRQPEQLEPLKKEVVETEEVIVTDEAE